jgi:hypothetical protein
MRTPIKYNIIWFLASGLDYKALMSGEDPLSVLQPVLLASNVHAVAKLANKIPSKEHGTLTSGMVFRAFAEKLLWTGDEKHQRPQSTVSSSVG